MSSTVSSSSPASRAAGLARARHLVRRFLGSLRPGGPAPAVEARVASLLSPAEAALWRRMSGPDRRHAVAVAARVARSVPARGARAGGAPAWGAGPPVDRGLLVAALLHDVGKVDSGLGTLARVVATVIGLARSRVGPAPLAHLDRPAPADRGRMARYLAHDRIGAGLLEQAASDPLVVAWAGQHHLPPDRWTVPQDLGARLKAADDD